MFVVALSKKTRYTLDKKYVINRCQWTKMYCGKYRTDNSCNRSILHAVLSLSIATMNHISPRVF